MGGPVCARFDGGEEGGGGGAGVGGFQGVVTTRLRVVRGDEGEGGRKRWEECLWYLNIKREILLGIKHPINNHSCHLTRNHILRDPKLYLPTIITHIPLQQPQHLAIDTKEVFSMLPRILQSSSSDLRELAASQEPRWDEGVGGGDIALPIGICCFMARFWLSIIEEAFVLSVIFSMCLFQELQFL